MKLQSFQPVAANLALAAFYLYFAQANITNLLVEFKLSVFLLLLYNSSVVIIALIRRAPLAISRSVFDHVIAFCGTLSPLLFLGTLEAGDHWLLLAMQVTGIGVAYAGLLSLNRSFGLVPANRGIVTAGMYRYVRHPLYAGYLLLCSGFILQNFSERNVIAFVAFVIFESLRLLIEEDFLSRDREYAEYKKCVRWRILPFVW